METEDQEEFSRGGVRRESVHPKAERARGRWGGAEKNGMEKVPGCRLLPNPAGR